MLETIDRHYLRAMAELPDGWERLERFVEELIQERETAEQIAAAVVRDAAPLRRRVDGLLAANNALVEERRALQAYIMGTPIKPESGHG